MIYTLYRLPNQPIILVRPRPPMHWLKDIYALDEQVARMADLINADIVVRIDDFSLLQPHDFTLADAILWLTDILREEEPCQERIAHVAVAPDHIVQLSLLIYEEDIAALRLPLFPTLADALHYAQLRIARQAGGN